MNFRVLFTSASNTDASNDVPIAIAPLCLHAHTNRVIGECPFVVYVLYLLRCKHISSNDMNSTGDHRWNDDYGLMQ